MGEFEITTGVPQGSVLGPLLWNIFYDKVLRMEVSDEVKLIGYADDLAVIVIEKNEEDLRERTKEALRLVGVWMRDNGYSLAPIKSEAVLLEGRRTIRKMSVCMEGRMIETREAVRYLGVKLQRNLRVAEQVERVVRKAKMVVGALDRRLLNVGGSRASKRRVLFSVVHGVSLFGAEAWIDGYRIQKNPQILLGIQRIMLMRVCCAYRKVSGRLIPNLTEWINRGHGEVNHYTCQVLTGHGSFGGNLKNIGKIESVVCWYCKKGVEENVEHAILNVTDDRG